MTTAADQTRLAVWSALGTVMDPELDEPVTDLGFVSHCEVTSAGEVIIRLRLPTYFCAPNFAFLMVADAYDAVTEVLGVREAVVELIDHFAAAAINRGVAGRVGFRAAFGAETTGELDDLRADFLRKAVLAGTDRVCRAAVAAGAHDLAGLTLGDAPASRDRERLQARRRVLGLPHADHDPLVIDSVTGAAIGPAGLRRHLMLARLTRVSQEANSGLCRGMLWARYGTESRASGSQPRGAAGLGHRVSDLKRVSTELTQGERVNEKLQRSRTYVQTPKEIHAAIASAFNSRDLDTFVELYEDNGVMIIPPNGERVEGEAAIRAGMEQLFANDLTLRVEIIEVHEADDIAVAHSRWWLASLATDDGVDMSGLGTLVSRKQPDGRWLVVLEHTMTPS